MSSKPSRSAVAVLGGAGAMGRAAVFDLARDGRRVLALDTDLPRSGASYADTAAGAATAETADARDRERLARQLADAGVVVNCAPYRAATST